MRKLAAALLASTALALQPDYLAYGQTAADSNNATIGQSGFSMPSFGGVPGLGYFDPISRKVKSVPIAPVQLPAPTTTTRGGATDAAAPANQFQTGTSAGVPVFAQPAFSNLSGAATVGQMAAALSTAQTYTALQTFGGGINVSGGSVAIPNGGLSSAGTGQFAAFVVGNGTTGAFKGVQSTYDTTNNVGAIQSIWSGNAYTPLKINPGGGAVTTVKNTLDDGAGNAAVAGTLGVTGALTAPVKAAGATAAVDLGSREALLGFVSTDFGVKCDGTTNDTTAMQALINASAGLGVQVELVPRGSTCLANIKTASNLHARIDGTLKTATLGQNLIANSSVGGSDSNVVLEGDGVLDNGYPAGATAPPASAPVGCIDTYGALSYWSVRGLTLQNCGNWPVNIVGASSSQTGGSKHIYFSYVKALGAGNRNSFEFADGCDDCWADHILVDGLAGDIGFAFYGPIVNSGITNSRLSNNSLGIAVLADGAVGSAPNSFPSSNILIQGNELIGNSNEAIEIHGSSTASAYYHHNIRIIGNDGHGNNANVATSAGQVNKGGETIIECDGCYSPGNFFHEDGAGNATPRPVAGISIYAAAMNFTSVGDTVLNEGAGGGVGLGAVVTNGTTNPSFSGLRAYDNQATATMVQAINGTCAADCTIIGTKTSGFTSPWAGLSFSGSSKLWMNEGLGNYVQQDVILNGYITALSGVIGPNLAANGANGQVSVGSLSATGSPRLTAFSSGTSTKDYEVVYSGGTAGTANKGTATYNGSIHAFNGSLTNNGLFVQSGNTAGAWATYTPGVACSSGTLGSYTVVGRYATINKSVNISISVKITSVGSCSGVINASLPVNAANQGASYYLDGREDGPTGSGVKGQIMPNAAVAGLLVGNSSGVYTTYTPANNWQLDVSGTYESQ